MSKAKAVKAWLNAIGTLIQDTGLPDITCTLTVSHALPHQSEEAQHESDGKWYYEEKNSTFKEKLSHFKRILSTPGHVLYPGALYNDLAQPALQGVHRGTQAYRSVIEHINREEKGTPVTVKTMRPTYAQNLAANITSEQTYSMQENNTYLSEQTYSMQGNNRYLVELKLKLTNLRWWLSQKKASPLHTIIEFIQKHQKNMQDQTATLHFDVLESEAQRAHASAAQWWRNGSLIVACSVLILAVWTYYTPPALPHWLQAISFGMPLVPIILMVVALCIAHVGERYAQHHLQRVQNMTESMGTLRSCIAQAPDLLKQLVTFQVTSSINEENNGQSPAP